MKVAFVTELFTPETGGVERHSYELVKRMSLDPDFQVEVFTTECNTTMGSVPIHKLSPYTVISPPERDFKLSMRFVNAVKSALKERDFDLVFANGHMAMLACRNYKKCPVVAEIHDVYGKDWKFMAKGMSRYIGPIFESYILKGKYKTLISVNKTIVKLLKEKYKQNAKYLANGIDLKYIDGVHFNLENENVVLFVGRLAPQKNFEELYTVFVELLKNRPDLTLKVIGEGEDKQKFENLIKDNDFLKKRIIFLGNIGKKGHENIIKELKKSKMIVIPSKRESFGIIILEAMASYTPVIASDCDGPIDLIDGTNGWLYKLGNHSQLLGYMHEILNEKEYTIAKVYKAREFIKNYDWDNIYQQFKLILREAKNGI